MLDYDPEPGDVFVLNDPFEGGTHLPDVTMVSPVTVDGEVLGYAVSRAHHADVGGMTPGSMPAGAREIYQEGIRLPPVRLVKRGDVNDDVMSLLLANVRNPDERRADIRAQIAANDRAEERLRDLVDEHGRSRVRRGLRRRHFDYSRDRILAELAELPNGTYSARDVLEGDGITDEEIPIEVAVNDRRRGDFRGLRGNRTASTGKRQRAVRRREERRVLRDSVRDGPRDTAESGMLRPDFRVGPRGVAVESPTPRRPSSAATSKPASG